MFERLEVPAGGFAEPRQCVEVEGAYVAVAGGGRVLERHRDHHPLPGDPQRFGDDRGTDRVVDVFEQVDRRDRVGAVVGNRHVRGVAHQGVDGQAETWGDVNKPVR